MFLLECVWVPVSVCGYLWLCASLPNSRYFWFDVFTNAQHAQQLARPFTWWQHVFAENVRRIGRTVVVLEWERPRPLTRVWCLWEITSTLLAPTARLDIAMSEAHEAAFQAALTKDFGALVNQLCAVDVAKAQATQPSDRDAIFNAVESSVGFDGVNTKVLSAMREWMSACGAAAVAGLACPADEVPGTDLHMALACLLRDHGRLETAGDMFRRALGCLEPSLGPAHPKVLNCLAQYGLCLRLHGKNDAAEEVLVRAVEGRCAVLGEEHVDTLTAKNSLAAVFTRLGRRDAARDLFKQVLEGRKRVLGDAHVDTLLVAHNYALLIMEADPAGAEQLLRHVLAARREVLGEFHPDTTGTVGALGILLRKTNRLEEAEPLYHLSYKGKVRVLGERHPDTLSALFNLGILQSAKHEFSAAEETFSEVARRRFETLGSHSRDALRSLVALADVQKDAGKVAQAEATLQHVLALCSEAPPSTSANLESVRVSASEALAALGTLPPEEGAPAPTPTPAQAAPAPAPA